MAISIVPDSSGAPGALAIPPGRLAKKADGTSADMPRKLAQEADQELMKVLTLLRAARHEANSSDDDDLTLGGIQVHYSGHHGRGQAASGHHDAGALHLKVRIQVSPRLG